MKVLILKISYYESVNEDLTIEFLKTLFQYQSDDILNFRQYGFFFHKQIKMISHYTKS